MTGTGNECPVTSENTKNFNHGRTRIFAALVAPKSDEGGKRRKRHKRRRDFLTANPRSSALISEDKRFVPSLIFHPRSPNSLRSPRSRRLSGEFIFPRRLAAPKHCDGGNLMETKGTGPDADFGRSAIVFLAAHKCSGNCSDKPNHLRSDH